ncbi:hypothetical protein [Helicobacter mesocricetorum]|uniref:hypothetical protein n=1 Tax=Helicobacter mesocricetorum TaxID=87012 RepID=UPI000CF14695|nr:hypothetical protein [Helicobacter mesocricetorum]
MDNETNTKLDIGVSIPKMDSRFMDSIMSSGIADSGIESTGDVFFEDNLKKSNDAMTEKEFELFLDEVGIGAKNFREW